MFADWRFARIAAKLVPLVLGLAAVCHAAEDDRLQQFRKSQLHMGVEFEIVLYAPTAERADAALAKAFERIAALDKILSDYDPASELSKLSETSTVAPGTSTDRPPPTAKPVPLGDELWKVLEYAQDLSRASDGAFDVTIGPLTKLWRRARRQQELPAPERLAEARAAVGNAGLKLDEREHSAQLLRANMRLDLGGIAKGLAADEALAELQRAGIERALVRASGDIAVADPPPGETGWRIGIAPLDPDDPPQHFVRLANRAISTSGDARQHLVVDGTRYSHIIDPRTGLGVSGRSSVSVIAPRGMQADALGTAVSVLGPDKGMQLVGRTEGALMLMVAENDDGQRREIRSPGFAELLEPAR
jgi:thiamine biosynthesis lipoprotein